MIQALDHIGIAVHSLDEAVVFYRDALGLTASPVEEIASQEVRTVFFNLQGVRIELLEPTSPDSPIARFLEKNGPGIHHLALRTDDITQQLGQASSAGCRLINSTPFIGAEEKSVAFLHPKSCFGVLLELCQELKKEGKAELPVKGES
jgi:methylmalonyl-CoA/ethylmalonyl-CoA epimerase